MKWYVRGALKGALFGLVVIIGTALLIGFVALSVYAQARFGFWGMTTAATLAIIVVCAFFGVIAAQSEEHYRKKLGGR